MSVLGAFEEATRGRVVRLATALAVAACIVGGATGCGGGDESDESVAVVGNSEIDRGELDAQVESLRRAQQTGTTPPAAGTDVAGGGSAGNGQETTSEDKSLERQALSMLLLAEAIEQEAADRGIEATDEEVRARWNAAVGEQFRDEKALRRFLGGRTEQDALDQLRLQLLVERIHAQVAEQAGGGKRGRKAVAKFQREFQRRWREKTDCQGDGQTASLCSGND